MLTDKSLRALKPSSRIYEVADRAGLSARVNPSGRITFQYRYRLHSRAERLKLGVYPEIPLAEARAKHADARKLVAQGKSPALERRTAMLAAAKVLTVKDLADEFIERFAKVHRRRPDIVIQMVRADILPAIGSLPVDHVTRRDIIQMLDSIVDRRAPVQANRTASVVKQLFRYAIDRGMIETSPCGELRRQSIGGTERSRERCLSPEEIKLFWERLPLATQLKPYPLSKASIAGLRLLLVTGQRRGELTKARWSELDLANSVWHIPAEHSKNGRAHKVPLSPLAVKLFEELKSLAGDSVYVLPTPHSRRRGDVPMTERSLTKAAERAQAVVGIAKWVPHDLRRTATTQLAHMGAPPQVIEKILNHTMQGVLAVYNRHDYFAECSKALNRWALHIQDVTAVGASGIDPEPRRSDVVHRARLRSDSEETTPSNP
jgi:integrase